jgi:hypothetical protein
MYAVSLLDEKSEIILKAIRDLGAGWHGRAEIAKALDKKRLYTEDVLVLDHLVEKGLLEIQRQDIEGPIPVRWEYRLKI